MFELPKIPDRRLPPNAMSRPLKPDRLCSALATPSKPPASTLSAAQIAATPAIAVITRRTNAPSHFLCSTTSKNTSTATRIFEPSRRWNLPDIAQNTVSHEKAA